MAKPCRRSCDCSSWKACARVTGRGVSRVILPRTRGSMMNVRFSRWPNAPITVSTSASRKFRVMLFGLPCAAGAAAAGGSAALAARGSGMPVSSITNATNPAVPLTNGRSRCPADASPATSLRTRLSSNPDHRPISLAPADQAQQRLESRTIRALAPRFRIETQSGTLVPASAPLQMQRPGHGRQFQIDVAAAGQHIDPIRSQRPHRRHGRAHVREIDGHPTFEIARPDRQRLPAQAEHRGRLDSIPGRAQPGQLCGRQIHRTRFDTPLTQRAIDPDRLGHAGQRHARIDQAGQQRQRAQFPAQRPGQSKPLGNLGAGRAVEQDQAPLAPPQGAGGVGKTNPVVGRLAKYEIGPGRRRGGHRHPRRREHTDPGQRQPSSPGTCHQRTPTRICPPDGTRIISRPRAWALRAPCAPTRCRCRLRG
jgi:hypothetical protein